MDAKTTATIAIESSHGIIRPKAVLPVEHEVVAWPASGTSDE